ncbi:hypothetical protein ACIPL1_18015 [Pseudomonas sp. NPDC090202]|uniref:hypothetical protein n=1 Tax=unclassified Pseudomonas TaxID=196821 RepID=UPI00380A311C
MSFPGMNKLTNPFTTLVTSGGNALSGASNLASNVSNQANIIGGGNTAALDATKQENALNDQNNAQLAHLQGAEARKTATQNTMNAIQSANNDAASKFISSTAQSAKAISY